MTNIKLKAMAFSMVLNLSFVICPLSLLSGCSGGKPPPGVLAYSNSAEPQTLDPSLMTGQVENNIIVNLLEGLTRLNPDSLKQEPGMAESWVVSPDRRVYTFTLRQAVWSDGVPVRASDFAYSWLRSLAPATASEYAYQLFYLKGASAYNEGRGPAEGVAVKVLDERHLRVELNDPIPYFLGLTSFMTLLPERRDLIERWGAAWTEPDHFASNGPYLLAEHRPYRRIVFKKNPGYWDAAAVKIPEAWLYPVDDANTDLRMYLAGQIQWTQAIPLEKRSVYMKRPDFRKGPAFTTSFLRFNVTRKPLDNPDLRKALSLALDREALTSRILRGGEIPYSSFVPPGLPDYHPVAGLSFDPEAAKAALARAGFPGGRGFPKLSFLSTTSRGGGRRLAEAFQEMWRKTLGVEVELRQQEWKVYLASMTALDYDIVSGGWFGDYLDANTFIDMFLTGGGNNRTGFSNPEYDHLVALAARELDGRKREALFQRCEAILVREQVPIAPLYVSVNLALISPRLKGVEPNLVSHNPLAHAHFEDGPEARP